MFVALKGAQTQGAGVARELCKNLLKPIVNKYQVATLTRAAYREEDEVPNIKPFPYHRKHYHIINSLFDTWKNRVGKHSKLIVIDGPVASGKNSLAQALAKEFDFLYLPQPTFDDLYITPWGYDVREMDCKLPKPVQTWDIERFLQCGIDENNLAMQNYMLLMRQRKYIQCLAHLLCTGQGVVTIRSPWADSIFAKAMYQNGYISKGALEVHTDCCLASNYFYLRPHLIIYLDVPVDKTMQNIKKRGRSYEVNSKVLNEKYLNDIEENYKRDYLSKMADHCLLLIYDWSQGGDYEVVWEDIENLDFDCYTDHDSKLLDWQFSSLQHKMYMEHYTSGRDILLQHMDMMRTDVPEWNISGNDMEAFMEEWEKKSDSMYAKGYNVKKGDKGVMFKTHTEYWDDHVTPLMEKYYERREREKKAMRGK